MRPRTLPIYVLIACTFTAVSARGFILPLYAHELGVSRSNVGVLFAAFAVASAALSIPSGHLADRFGRRNMLLAAAVAGLVTQLAISTTTSFPLMLVWQLLGGIGIAASQTAMTAAVIDAVPHERLGRATGWISFAMQGGFLLGPGAAGLLTRFLDLPLDMVVTAALYLPAFALSFLVPHGRPHPTGADGAGVRSILARRGVIPVLIGLMAGTMLYGTFSAYIPLFGKEQLGLPATQIGLLIGLVAVSNGLSRIFSGRLVERVRRRGPMTAASIVGFSAFIALLPWLSGFWAPAVAAAVAAPLVAITFVSVGTTFNQLAPPEARGLAAGVYSTFLNLGLTLGPALYGPLMQSSGYRAGFAACAGGSSLLAALMLLVRFQPVRRLRGAVPMPPSAGV